jgi:hypothetical protein
MSFVPERSVPDQKDSRMTLKPGSFRLMVLLLALLAGLAIFVAALYRVASPQLLLPQADARWVISPHPINLAAEGPRLRVSQFRAVLALPVPPSPAIAQLRSLGASELFINGRSAARSQPQHGRIEELSVDIAPYLQPGDNDIVVVTRHLLGPAAMLFSCAGLGLKAAMDWQVSVDGRSWRQAAAATDRAEQTGVRADALMQWNGPEQLQAHAGLLLLLAAAGAVVALAVGRAAPSPTRSADLLRAWQWFLLLGLMALHAWNFSRLPLLLGMDMVQHVDYVNYILQRHALPLADQGWQMFQPPLAYLMAAMLESLRAELAPGLPSLGVLRLLTLACSLGTAWVACRLCALAFERASTAAAAMVVAAFLPVSLYMAPAFSNEPFAALFGTLLVLEAVRLLKGATLARWTLMRIGLWLGLGLLSKPSVVLLLPALLVLLAWRGRSAAGAAHWGASARPVMAVLALAVMVAGWWYGRNLLHFGRPFVGGWEAGRGADWWQYPGFRVPEHWLRFGEVLIRPLYSGLDSFWDSIYSTLWLDGMLSSRIQMDYSPPWNYPFMAPLALLSLPVLAAIVWGAVRAVCWPKSDLERGLALFAGANLVLFLMAMAGMYGRVAAYSAGKGSYLLSALGCLAILAGLGVDGLLQRAYSRVAVSAAAAVWLGFVALAFMAQ